MSNEQDRENGLISLKVGKRTFHVHDYLIKCSALTNQPANKALFVHLASVIVEAISFLFTTNEDAAKYVASYLLVHTLSEQSSPSDDP